MRAGRIIVFSLPSMCRAMLLSVFLVSLFCFGKCQDGPKVNTTYGWLQGGYSTTRGGRQIVEFLGIKYAKSPSGNLRFKICPKKLMPVIFFIHGGSYMQFSSDRLFYGPELFLDRDIVLVTINFRLGVLGFLSTEDDIIPGNWGMKDQTAALHWVRDNIAQFGGAPHSVTLMGESSGAASVHLHMLSPLSRGLFQKGIVHSASAWVPWAVAEPEVLKSRTCLVAERVDCPSTPSEALLSCLQSVSADKIVATTRDFIIWDSDPIIIWNPVIEHSAVKDAFLTKSPRDLASDLPLLIGFNFAEGAFKTLRVTSGDVEDKFQQWNSNFENLTAMSLFYDRTAPNPASVTAELRKFYFASAEKITPQMTTQITQAYGDLWFANGILDAVDNHKGRKFLYYFNYNNTAHFSLLGLLMNNSLYLGTGHFDELPYFFPMRGSYKIVDSQMSANLIELWTNFAKSSAPTGASLAWEPVTSAALEYLDVSNDGIGMKTWLLKERRKFFKTLKLRKE